MPLKQLTEKDKNISYAIGFLESWTKDDPAAVIEHLSIVTNAVKEYRDQYVDEQELNIDLQRNYNELTVVSAGYLAEIQLLRVQIDELLTEQQRSLHKTELQNENENS